MTRLINISIHFILNYVSVWNNNNFKDKLPQVCFIRMFIFFYFVLNKQTKVTHDLGITFHIYTKQQCRL